MSILKSIKIGTPKALCRNCGKEYDIVGQPKFSDMLNRIKINDCSDMYNTKSCKKEDQ